MKIPSLSQRPLQATQVCMHRKASSRLSSLAASRACSFSWSSSSSLSSSSLSSFSLSDPRLYASHMPVSSCVVPVSLVGGADSRSPPTADCFLWCSSVVSSALSSRLRFLASSGKPPSIFSPPLSSVYSSCALSSLSSVSLGCRRRSLAFVSSSPSSHSACCLERTFPVEGSTSLAPSPTSSLSSLGSGFSLALRRETPFVPPCLGSSLVATDAQLTVPLLFSRFASTSRFLRVSASSRTSPNHALVLHSQGLSSTTHTGKQREDALSLPATRVDRWRSVSVPKAGFASFSRRRSRTSASSFLLQDTPSKRPRLLVKAAAAANLQRGRPWIFRNDVLNADELDVHAPCFVEIAADERGDNSLGVALYNAESTVAARVFCRDRFQRIDEGFLALQLRRAADFRRRHFTHPFYRVCNGEGDDLPGIILDRYGPHFVLQLNAAGLDDFLPVLQPVIEDVFEAELSTLLLRNDSPLRRLEKLPLTKSFLSGYRDTPVELLENGSTFLVDLLEGERTGWNFQQRPTREMLAPLCRRRTVLDLFSHGGAFGIQAATHGASIVVCVHPSSASVELGRQNIEANNFSDCVVHVQADILPFLLQLATDVNAHQSQSAGSARNSLGTLPSSARKDASPSDSRTHVAWLHESVSSERTAEAVAVARASVIEKFDVVMLDMPPVFSLSASKAADHVGQILRAAVNVTAQGGLLLTRVESTAIGRFELLSLIRRTLQMCGEQGRGRGGKIVGEGSLAIDHPINVALPESRHSHSFLIALD
ncbi:UNVERIFIED_CONTAM: SAM-dependent methyltransferase [Hammondia hammondi]|eukprot:XP_008882645.1 SAM-dependent methyltransferase [Hammondia hammondi]